MLLGVLICNSSLTAHAGLLCAKSGNAIAAGHYAIVYARVGIYYGWVYGHYAIVYARVGSPIPPTSGLGLC